MRILLTGANGFIGSQLVAALLDAGHRVVGAVRDPDAFRARFPAADALACDMNLDTAAAAWRGRLAGVDAVVNCAGVMQSTRQQNIWAIHAEAPIALFDACVEAGVRRVVQISAISVAASTDYAMSKRAADERLMTLPLEWVVLRPSLVYAEGSYGGTSLLRAFAAMPLVMPVVGSGAQPFSPLHARDLARVVLAAIEDAKLARKTLEVVGPERLTQLEIQRKLRAWMGCAPVPVLRVPLWLARVVGAFGRVFGTVSFNSNAVDQLEHGNAGDPAPLKAALGWLPEPMDVWLARQPAQVQDRLHARLQLLRLPITLALAALWIVSGVVGLGWTHLFVTDIGYPLGLSGEDSRSVAFALCGMDVLIGMLVLLRWRVEHLAWAQLLMVLGYTLGLGLLSPEHWNDPFGGLLKNLPILVLIPVWAALERER